MRHELRASVVVEKKDSRLDPPTNHPLRDAYATLHILPTAPPELVKAAYRCLAMMHHPDRGGETETMQRINHAYAQLSGRIGS